MAESEISWTDFTFNPWIGCTKVSPACDHCYAERDNSFRGWNKNGWGNDAPRVLTKTPWKNAMKWNREAPFTGKRIVFAASLADIFDNHASIEDEWRQRLWMTIRATPNLRWILLTKRIGNARKMLPPDWPFKNAGIMATLESQEVWDRDYPKLMQTPATWRGVSAEPLLGAINMGPLIEKFGKIDWMITGGESGKEHRTLDMDWVRDIHVQCHFRGITFHHKQNGGVRGKDAGCLIDGAEYKNFPPDLAA